MPTVISRCQTVPFFPLNDSEIRSVLNGCGYFNISDEVIELAQGSPLKAITFHQLIESINNELLNCFKPNKVSDALSLAKEIASLPLEQQLLMADYWGYKHRNNKEFIEVMEIVKSQLLKANHQLVWEVNLIKLTQSIYKFR